MTSLWKVYEDLFSNAWCIQYYRHLVLLSWRRGFWVSTDCRALVMDTCDIWHCRNACSSRMGRPATCLLIGCRDRACVGDGDVGDRKPSTLFRRSWISDADIRLLTEKRKDSAERRAADVSSSVQWHVRLRDAVLLTAPPPSVYGYGFSLLPPAGRRPRCAIIVFPACLPRWSPTAAARRRAPSYISLIVSPPLQPHRASGVITLRWRSALARTANMLPRQSGGHNFLRTYFVWFNVKICRRGLLEWISNNSCMEPARLRVPSVFALKLNVVKQNINNTTTICAEICSVNSK